MTTKNKDTVKNQSTWLSSIIDRKKQVILISMIVLTAIVSFLLFRHYVLVPRDEQLRFKRVEEVIDASIANLGDRVEIVGDTKKCRNTGEKYSSGSRFCTYETSFKPLDTMSLPESYVLNAVDSIMSKNYVITTGERGHVYKDGPMSCILEIPGKGPKSEPVDAYTLKCSSYVTKYVY